METRWIEPSVELLEWPDVFRPSKEEMDAMLSACHIS